MEHKGGSARAKGASGSWLCPMFIFGWMDWVSLVLYSTQEKGVHMVNAATTSGGCAAIIKRKCATARTLPVRHVPV